MQVESTTPNMVTVVAPAKINLCFDILARREDGYHEVVTLFQALDLCDILTFKFSKTQDNTSISQIAKISIKKKDDCIEASNFPLDDNNLIARAINTFLDNLPKHSPILTEVEVNKKIPIGAGLAGGSTNAAATLVALNHYFAKPFTDEVMNELAAKIGSDVAFCLKGGSAIGRGRGEQLEKTNLDLEYYFILVKPRTLHISTPWAYKMYDEFIKSAGEQKTPSVLSAALSLQHETNIEKQAKVFWNVFEPVIFKEYPLLAQIKKRLLDLGCLSVHLTGSGPTIFGLVKNKEAGEKILAMLEPKINTDKDSMALDTWLCKSINYGAKVIENN